MLLDARLLLFWLSFNLLKKVLPFQSLKSVIESYFQGKQSIIIQVELHRNTVFVLEDLNLSNLSLRINIKRPHKDFPFL